MYMLNPCVSFHSEDDRQRLIERRIKGPGFDDLSDRWRAFLEENPPESAMQDFFERHPVLLPGLFDYHNGPLHDVVVTKLPLGPDYKTDFAFISRHSMALQFTFVEIEAPAKKIFNQDDSFTKDFNHAKQQVMDWVRWSQDHLNVLMDMFAPLFETYKVTDDLKEVRGYLIYGRREEVEVNRQRKQRWQGIRLSSDRSVIVMTYDRLGIHESDRKSKHANLIVCTYEKRQLYAKSSLL